MQLGAPAPSQPCARFSAGHSSLPPVTPQRCRLLRRKPRGKGPAGEGSRGVGQALSRDFPASLRPEERSQETVADGRSSPAATHPDLNPRAHTQTLTDFVPSPEVSPLLLQSPMASHGYFPPQLCPFPPCRSQGGPWQTAVTAALATGMVHPGASPHLLSPEQKSQEKQFPD